MDRSMADILHSAYTYKIIESIAGEWEANKWLAWEESIDRQNALKKANRLNSRNRIIFRTRLPISDGRTRGARFLKAKYEEFSKDYEARIPRPKEAQGSNVFISRINGKKVV